MEVEKQSKPDSRDLAELREVSMKLLREFDSGDDAGLLVSVLNWYCIPYVIGVRDAFIQVFVPERDYSSAVEMMPVELELNRE